MEAVATAGKATALEADEIGIVGWLDLPQMGATTAPVAPALEIPVSRDSTETDSREDIGARAAATGVGIDAGADNGITAAITPNMEVNINGSGGSNKDEKDLGAPHIE